MQPSPSAALLTSASTISTPRVSTESYRPGKSSLSSGIIVKKKTGSLTDIEKPLFSSTRREEDSRKEEILNGIRAADAVFPLPSPLSSNRSPGRSANPSDKQKIAELESKLTRLAQRYKRLESSYKALLVKSVERERATPDLDHTRDSVQWSPKRQGEEPLQEVVHILTELRSRIDRVENLTSSMWAVISPSQGSATDRY